MNKIGILFFALSTMGIGTLSAQTADSTQTSPWTKEGFAGLKLTQVSLTNWAAGGDNSVAFDTFLNIIRTLQAELMPEDESNAYMDQSSGIGIRT